MMKIISLHGGHDSSITAFENGQILYHWELERVLNEKHFCAFDKGNEVADVLYNHCLPKLGWKVEDIDIVGFTSDSEWIKTEFAKDVPTYDPLKYDVPYGKGKIKLRGSSREIDCYAIIHHVNHAACAYYTSPFKDALVYTMDGIGDQVAGVWGIGRDNKLFIKGELTKNPPFGLKPNAIGLTYSYLYRIFPFLNVGKHIELSCAGKQMGLSSYGKPRDEWRNAVRSILNQWMPQPERLIKELNLQNENLSDPMSKTVQDLSATIQDEAELFVCESIKTIQDNVHETFAGYNNLCMAGGCALNVQINTRLLKDKIVEQLFIPPACNDGGLSMGNCLYIWHHILNNSFEGMKWHNPYLGDTLYNHPSEVKDFNKVMAEKYPTIKYKKFDTEDMAIMNAATELYNNKIIGWAYGRAEIGPRSLGGRNILANPCNPDMKDIVNAKIKHREYWRPYAPAGLEEEVSRYWQMDHHNYYMLESPLVRDEASAKLLPSVTHFDNTGRIQSVNRTTHEQFFKLLKDFKMLKGVGVLLSTSFNGHGQPILNNLYDMLNMLRDTELDSVYVGNWKFWKAPTIKD